jgi:hypothetical protein
VVLGTAGVAVMAGLAAAATGAATHREISSVQAELSRASDALTRTNGTEGVPYVSCAQPADYQPGVSGVLSSAATVTAVEFWDGSSWATVCDQGEPERLQRIAISYSIGDTTQQLQILKRPLTEPPAYARGTLPDGVEVEEVDFDTFEGYTDGIDATTTTTVPGTTTTVPGTTTTVPGTTTTTTLPAEECTVQSVGVSPNPVQRVTSGSDRFKLADAVTVTIAASGDCDDLELYVETGWGNGSYTVSFSGTPLTATLPAGDAKWSAGTHTLEVRDDGSTIATSSLEVE